MAGIYLYKYTNNTLVYICSRFDIDLICENITWGLSKHANVCLFPLAHHVKLHVNLYIQ